MKGEWHVEGVTVCDEDGKWITAGAENYHQEASITANKHNAMLKAAVEAEREAIAVMVEEFSHPRMAERIRARKTE